MPSTPQRIAQRYLRRKAGADPLPRIDSTLKAVIRHKDALKELHELASDLIKAGEARRLDRAGPIKPTDVVLDANSITATIKGISGTYQTRITFPPKRGHHCTCPDWVQNGRKIGPCKHVLALGLYLQNERILPALYRLEDGIMSILEHSSI